MTEEVGSDHMSLSIMPHTANSIPLRKNMEAVQSYMVSGLKRTFRSSTTSEGTGGDALSKTLALQVWSCAAEDSALNAVDFQY